MKVSSTIFSYLKISYFSNILLISTNSLHSQFLYIVWCFIAILAIGTDSNARWTARYCVWPLIRNFMIFRIGASQQAPCSITLLQFYQLEAALNSRHALALFRSARYAMMAVAAIMMAPRVYFSLDIWHLAALAEASRHCLDIFDKHIFTYIIIDISCGNICTSSAYADSW